ncbi:DsrE family protein [Sphingomonas sp. ZB1N12]|uniref:DsrE family protein n=1 Tax=Sphingomonas arabinosi TaxID=3096160 RepID=UPI002FC908B7
MKHFLMGSLLIAASAAIMPATAMAQLRDGPAITGYGKTFPTVGAHQRPDAKIRYRVLFNITKAAMTPDKPNPSLEKVARFMNLLAIDGVKPSAGDIVAIVHGPATPSIVQDTAYAKKTGGKSNPNLPLIAQLKAAGVTVAVCDQALQGQGFTEDEVVKDVRVDVAALTTLATLQLQGWALIPD